MRNQFNLKYPRRKHGSHWVDGGNQIAVLHPETYIPFFLNISGSKICRHCDNKHHIGEIISLFKKEWYNLPEEILIKDLLRFLLLLEELDLIEFLG